MSRPVTGPAPRPVQGQSPRAKKAELYANQIASEAVAKEKGGSPAEAVSDYLRAAEIFMLLSKGEQNYTLWKTYSDRAEACQHRAKLLISSAKE